MENRRLYSVAIDGPSGAGKSTIARAAAGELGFRYVDTGAIYRAVGCALLERGIDPGDSGAVEAALPDTEIAVSYDGDGLQRVSLNGRDVTGAIRRNEVSLASSKAAALPTVRAFLLEMQRDMARHWSVIMDGRDIGTVVLPRADVKIFLTAGEEARARRRYNELMERGTPRDYETLLREVRERDYNDSHRAAAPLRPAEDAVLLDTTEMTFRESLERVVEIIREGAGL